MKDNFSRNNGSPTAISTLEGINGTWVIVGTRGRIHWTKDLGAAWVSERFSHWQGASDTDVVGDSMFVVSANMGLLRLSESDTQLQRIIPGPQNIVYSFTDTDSGAWLKAEEVGVSRSMDEGATWSAFDTLFVQSCCTNTALVRSLGEGHIVAWAMTGFPEANIPRLHYSSDDGVTWTDSSSIASDTGFYEILRTPNHVELHLGDRRHFARTTWDSPRIEFRSDFSITDGVFSPVWGVVVTSGGGVHRLDESTYQWIQIGFDNNALSLIAAGPQGSLFVGASDGKLWKWTPVAAGLENLEFRKDDVIHVYPNPVSDVVHVSASGIAASYFVYDLVGRKRLSVNASRAAGGFSTSSLEPGVYFILTQDVRGRLSRASFLKY